MYPHPHLGRRVREYPHKCVQVAVAQALDRALHLRRPVALLIAVATQASAALLDVNKFDKSIIFAIFNPTN